MLLAGASAVGVGTATLPSIRARRYRMLDELVDWCARHGVARVARPHRRTGGGR